MSRTPASDLPSPVTPATANVAVEVAVRWGNTPVHIARVAAPRNFVVGESSRENPCDYALPEAKLGAVLHELVRFEKGRPFVLVPPGATTAGEVAPGSRVELAPDEPLEIHLADLTLVVRSCLSQRPVPRSVLGCLDRRLIGCWLGAAACALVAVGVWGLPRFTFGLSGEDSSRAPGYELRGYGVEGRVPASSAPSGFGRIPVRVARD
jgi:hypothetical protein